MTQREIDTMDLIVNKMVEGKKLSQALKEVYIKRNVIIPYNEDEFEVSVRDLEMSRRSTNALLRTGLKTLGDVIDYCKTHKITDIVNLGVGSGVEIFETILDYCWDQMTTSERTNFLIDTIQRNKSNVRV